MTENSPYDHAPSEPPFPQTDPLNAEMEALLTDKKPYLDQDAVYHHLSTALPMEEIVDKVISDFGAETSEAMVKSVRDALGDKYVCLLVEPSISTRLDQFIEFARAQPEDMEPWEARNLFRDSLGVRTVYRVVSANPQDMQSILDDGFVANFYRHRTLETLQANTDSYESMGYALSDLRGRVNIHAGAFANTEDSLLISVSEYPEVAQYAATVQLQDISTDLPEMPDSKIYTIPMEIGEFYLLRYGTYLPKAIRSDGVWTDGHQFEVPYDDPGVEAWVEFRVPPDTIRHDHIQEIDLHDVPQLRFVPKIEEAK